MPRTMIEAVGLHKSFGSTHALRGLDLSAAKGTVLAVLGPNGAGKTTAVRILTTLTHPDSGEALVAGVDVLKRPDEARTQFGVAGQYASLDEVLTGRENLEMIGRLGRLPAADRFPDRRLPPARGTAEPHRRNRRRDKRPRCPP